MPVDLTILQFFESIRSPLLDNIMLFITRFGEELILLPMICVLYWCFNKRQAIYVTFTLMLGLIANHVLKITFMVARPWVRWPQLTTVEGAAESATGYSLPSGHTTSAVSAYGGAAAWCRNKRWVWVAALAMIFLTGLSRVYLGVHTATDVLLAFLVGSLVVLIADQIRNWVNARPENKKMFIWGGIFLLTATTAFTVFKSYPADSSEELRADGLKTVGIALGILVGWIWETRAIRFTPVKKIIPAILITLIGLAGIFAIRLALKSVLISVFGILFGNFLRYFLIGFWVIGFYPFLFSKIFKN